MTSASEFKPLNLAVLTISDTRGPTEDSSGQFLVDASLEAGHNVVARRILQDEMTLMRAMVSRWIADPAINAVLITGGTGFHERDSTPKPWARCSKKPLKDLARNSAACLPMKSVTAPSNPARWQGWPTTPLSSACPAPRAPAARHGMALCATSSTTATSPATSRPCCTRNRNAIFVALMNQCRWMRPVRESDNHGGCPDERG